MRPDRIIRSDFLTGTALLLGAILLAAWLPLDVRAQDVGGDLGGAAGIFRPKNPETSSRRRAPAVKPPTGGRPTAGTPARRPAGGGGGARPSAASAAAAAELEERVEDALDEGNEARDARRYSDAERLYRSALQMKAREWRAAYALGNIYTDQQRWEEAERSYRQAVEWNQLSADAYIALSFVLVQPRAGGNNAKKLADAEQAARRAIQLQPGNATGYDRLGVALETRGVVSPDTEAAYRRSVELDPQWAVAHVHLAHLLRKMNRASEADPYYSRAVELAKDAPTLVLIAETLQSENRFDDSEPLLRRALEMDARNPSANYFLGRSLVLKKRYSEAEPLLKLAIEVSPRSFAPYYVLGSAYLRAERLEDAEGILNRAAEFASPGDRKLLAGSYGLSGVGDAYIRLGRPRDAVRAYERAVALDPGNTELQSKLADARTKG
ncbi:MAG TPA: tetratricopeptide repeat protein [Pyrinomonadaceae bacterium]|nr:tetratricopeptide repeat protein [Pyrinomonadaceae bacterium]